MPETLYIGSDINTAETKVLFDERDFYDLVEQYMGHDARKYLDRLIAVNEQALKDAYNDGYLDGSRDAFESTDEDEW